jgi:CYTH domain-containing protein
MNRRHREIERKFLVRDLPPGWRRHPHVRIEQGYLSAGKSGPSVRLRRIGDAFVLTVKCGGMLERDEAEIGLTVDQFRTLWPFTKGRRVLKDRYRIPLGKLTIELDVFRGRNRGRRLAEVEFPSVASSRRFRPEPWMGREVTTDPRYLNANLAC